MSFQDVDVVISASSPNEALRQFPAARPNAMIIDLHLGDGPNGIDLARACRRQMLEVGIVFLTSFESPKILVAVQKSIAKNRVSYSPEATGVSGLTNRQL